MARHHRDQLARLRHPVLRFSEVPELFVELINPLTDLPPLGLGESTGGPTVAAIGNAVAQALGMRIHDLPMTRERVMVALTESRCCRTQASVSTGTQSAPKPAASKLVLR